MTPKTESSAESSEKAERILWGAGTSRTIRAHWALCELDLAYRCEPILPRTDGMDRPDFAAVSPRGKIPILDDRGLLVGESGAIVLYLADRYSNGDIRLDVPIDDYAARATYYDLSFYILTELDATTLYVLRRHEGLPDIYGEAPTATAAAREYFVRRLGEVERRLADGRPYLLGEFFSSPDIFLTSCLAWAQFVEIEVPELLSDYRNRISARPAFRHAMETNFAPLAPRED